MSRKQNIINILTNNELGNQEILEQLSEQKVTCSKATLKRELQDLINQNLIISVGQAKNTKYKLSPQYQLFAEVDLQEYFWGHYSQRKIQDTLNSEIFALLLAAQSHILNQDEQKQIEKLNKEYQTRTSKLNEFIIKKELERLTIELSWKSSSIEGNTYSLLETETLIKMGLEATGHSQQEALMILNHKAALDHIANNKQDYKELSLDKILRIHEMLTQGLNIPQGLREQAIGISGTLYRAPILKRNVKQHLVSSIDLINQITHVPTKALVTLAMIAYLQAFYDGNKRTSRVLANATLMAHDYCPISFGTTEENEYKKALILFYEQNNIQYLKDIFVQQFEYSAENFFMI